MKKPRFYKITFPELNKDLQEGETIEEKVRRIVDNNEPISDGAPMIYTPKEDGVWASCNIRTDRWEIAQEAMSRGYKFEAKTKNNLETKKEEAKQEEKSGKETA